VSEDRGPAQELGTFRYAHFLQLFVDLGVVAANVLDELRNDGSVRQRQQLRVLMRRAQGKVKQRARTVSKRPASRTTRTPGRTILSRERQASSPICLSCFAAADMVAGCRVALCPRRKLRKTSVPHYERSLLRCRQIDRRCRCQTLPCSSCCLKCLLLRLLFLQ